MPWSLRKVTELDLSPDSLSLTWMLNHLNRTYTDTWAGLISQEYHSDLCTLGLLNGHCVPI